MEFSNSPELQKIPERKSLSADLNSLENGKTLEIKGELKGGVPVQEIICYKKLPSNIERVNYPAQNEKQKEGLFITKDIKIFNKNGDGESIHQMLSKKTIYLSNAKYNGLPEEDTFGLETMEFEKEEGGYRKIEVLFYGDLKEKGNILTLFHEIGHSWIDEKIEKQILDIELKLEGSWQAVKGKKRKTLKNNEVLYCPQYEKESYPVSKNLFVQYEKLLAIEERNAWAFALKRLHELKQKGFNLEPELDSLEKIEEFINSTKDLGGYEKEMDKTLGNPDEQNLFVKPHKPIK
ncbi:MAG: hypothetical protein PHE59_02325 [Patescibacteria group bacterium]|nr:hypothetical protein [Patescibacteria group bacterium]